ncbi:hypothetical protein OF83DRAFT_1175913 [Amylostereum chailletii]|nr:hypothetical protein OF83DRAFT_1175913 [Amylostereum chailletii]
MHSSTTSKKPTLSSWTPSPTPPMPPFLHQHQVPSTPLATRIWNSSHSPPTRIRSSACLSLISAADTTTVMHSHATAPFGLARGQDDNTATVAHGERTAAPVLPSALAPRKAVLVSNHPAIPVFLHSLIRRVLAHVLAHALAHVLLPSYTLHSLHVHVRRVE